MIEAIKKKLASDSREDNGFTLIELIIVVVIIAILAAIAIPLYNNFQDSARDSAVDASAANGLTYATSEVLNNPEADEQSIQAYLNEQDGDISVDVNIATPGNEGTICVTASYDGQDNSAQRGNCDGSGGGDPDPED